MNPTTNSTPEQLALERALRAAEDAKHGSYDKRTEHIDSEGRGVFINRLIREDSPYLLQHAHNPVNWYAWGDEAFATAREQDKPIFLSIGYSTCHWCHVMEVESFDNPDVAAVLNEHFISIKMDREQYPDVDEAYMTGVQIMTGHGGWPMSNLLLPSGEPFFGATYFPAQQFIAILNQVVVAWRDKREELETSAQQVQKAIEKILGDREQVSALDAGLFESTVDMLLQREDKERGGLAGAPKFPQEPLLLLLLEAAREGSTGALGFVDRALEAMARGGIYDQVAGGFARYSVDEEWLVPHFEKMLYNQSQLGAAYLEAYQLTRKPFFLRVLTQTLDYVLRDMQRPEGGFYSATDADSEGEEGVFFTWSLDELKAALNAEDYAFVCEVYGPTLLGNFEGSNILFLERPPRENDYARLDRILAELYSQREQRIHPLRDDKLIVAWSGAMASTLARAGYALNNANWLDAAHRAVQIMLAQNVGSDGSVRRIALNGTVSINGQLEDYANLAEALIALADTQPRDAMPALLTTARKVVSKMLEAFWDEASQGFFLGPAEQIGPRLTRSKSASDGATLSPVATALRCLHLLAERHEIAADAQTNHEDTDPAIDYGDFLRRGLLAVSGQLNEHPLSHASLLRLHAEIEQPPRGRQVLLDGGRAKLAVLGEVGAQSVESRVSRVVEIELQLAQGWHVSIDPAASASLPLAISVQEAGWAVESIAYPDASGGQLQGAQRIHLVLRPDAPELSQEPTTESSTERAAEDPREPIDQTLRLEFGVQLCSESECLLLCSCSLLV